MERNVPTTTIARLVTERPSRAAVFERHSVDYFCKGDRSLEEACFDAGLAIDQVLVELAGVEDDEEDAGLTDWSRRPVTELIDHIVTTHHEFLKKELVRLEGFLSKVVAGHGDRHPELQALQPILAEFKREIFAQLDKEEEILFPMIIGLLMVTESRSWSPEITQSTISRMRFQHDAAQEALERMRDLTNGFRPPEHACDCHRIFLHSLAILRHDMHQHMHKENNILFPSAVAASGGAAGDSTSHASQPAPAQ